MSETIVDPEPRAGRSGNSFSAFLSEARGRLLRREILAPALALAVLLTATNIVILLNLPAAKGVMPPLPFLVAGLVRLAAVIVVAVAVLRLASDSARPTWRPDGGFWLYALTLFAGIGLTALTARLLGDATGLGAIILRNIIGVLVLAPFTVWFVAIAVARPLAWKPRPWFRRFRLWLPQLLLWTLLLVTPLAVLHARIDVWLLEGAGTYFWPAALFDGVLSAAMALLALALNATAYRRVASAGALRDGGTVA